MEDDPPADPRREGTTGFALNPLKALDVEITAPEPEWIDKFFMVSEIETQDIKRFVEKYPVWVQHDQSLSELYELGINDIVHERLTAPLNSNFTPKENLQLSILLGSEGCGKSVFLRSLYQSLSLVPSPAFLPLYVSAADLFRSMSHGHVSPIQQLFEACLEHASSVVIDLKEFEEIVTSRQTLLLVDDADLLPQEKLADFLLQISPAALECRRRSLAKAPAVIQHPPHNFFRLAEGSRVVIASRLQGFRYCSVPQLTHQTEEQILSKLIPSFSFLLLRPSFMFDVLTTANVQPLLSSWKFPSPSTHVSDDSFVEILRSNRLGLYRTNILSPCLLFLSGYSIYYRIEKLNQALESGDADHLDQAAVSPLSASAGHVDPTHPADSMKQMEVHLNMSNVFDDFFDYLLRTKLHHLENAMIRFFSQASDPESNTSSSSSASAPSSASLPLSISSSSSSSSSSSLSTSPKNISVASSSSINVMMADISSTRPAISLTPDQFKHLVSLVGFLSHRLEDIHLFCGTSNIGETVSQLGCHRTQLIFQIQRFSASQDSFEAFGIPLQLLPSDQQVIGDFIDCIIDSLSPAFVSGIGGKIRCIHPHFQEYLAAFFLTNSASTSSLSYIINSLTSLPPQQGAQQSSLSTSGPVAADQTGNAAPQGFVLNFKTFRWNDGYFLTNNWWEGTYTFAGMRKGIQWIGAKVLELNTAPTPLTHTSRSKKKFRPAKDDEQTRLANWLAHLATNLRDVDDLGHIRFHLLLRIYASICVCRKLSVNLSDPIVRPFGEVVSGLFAESSSTLYMLENFPTNSLSCFTIETANIILSRCLELFTKKLSQTASSTLRNFHMSRFINDAFIQNVGELYGKPGIDIKLNPFIFWLLKSIDDSRLQKKSLSFMIPMLADEDGSLISEVITHVQSIGFEAAAQLPLKDLEPLFSQKVLRTTSGSICKSNFVSISYAKPSHSYIHSPLDPNRYGNDTMLNVRHHVNRAVKQLSTIVNLTTIQKGPSSQSSSQQTSSQSPAHFIPARLELIQNHIDSLPPKSRVIASSLSTVIEMIQQPDPAIRLLGFVALGSKICLRNEPHEAVDTPRSKSHELYLARAYALHLCKELTNRARSKDREARFAIDDTFIPVASTLAENTPGEYQFTSSLSRLISKSLGEKSSCWVSSIAQLFSYSIDMIHRVSGFCLASLDPNQQIKVIQNTFKSTFKSSAIQSQLLSAMEYAFFSGPPSSSRDFVVTSTVDSLVQLMSNKQLSFPLRNQAVQFYQLFLLHFPSRVDFGTLATLFTEPSTVPQRSTGRTPVALSEGHYQLRLGAIESWEIAIDHPSPSPNEDIESDHYERGLEHAVTLIQHYVSRQFDVSSLPGLQAAFSLLSKLSAVQVTEVLARLPIAAILVNGDNSARQFLTTFFESFPGTTFRELIRPLVQLLFHNEGTPSGSVTNALVNQSHYVRASASSTLGIIGRRGLLNEVAQAIFETILLPASNGTASIHSFTLEMAIRTLSLLGSNRPQREIDSQKLDSVPQEMVTLIASFLSHPYYRVQIAAIDSLSTFGEPSIHFLPQMIRLLRNADCEVREAVENTLLSLSSFFSPEKREAGTDLGDFFQECAQSDKYYERLAIMKVLQAFGPSSLVQNIKYIVHLLRDPDKSVRLDCLKALRPTFESKEVQREQLTPLLDSLVRLMSDRKVEIKREVLRLLRCNNDVAREIIEQVRQILLPFVEPRKVRMQGVILLGQLNQLGPDHIPTIIDMFGSRDPKILTEVSNVISNVGIQAAKLIPRMILKLPPNYHPGLKRKLLRILKDHEEQLRQSAGLLDIFDDISDMTRDSDTAVKRRAAELLVAVARIMGETIQTTDGRDGVFSGGLNEDGRKRIKSVHANISTLIRSIINSLTNLQNDMCNSTRRDGAYSLAEVGVAIPKAMQTIFERLCSIEGMAESSHYIHNWRFMSIRWRCLIPSD